MTPEDLDAIEARANAATEGPWIDRWEHIADEPEDNQRGIVNGGDETLKSLVVGCTWWDGHHLVLRKEDAAFISAARTDVPALVAEVRRLREAVRELGACRNCDGKAYCEGFGFCRQCHGTGLTDRAREVLGEKEGRDD